MSQRYGRRQWLTVGVPGTPGLRLEGMRMTWNIEKADGGAANTATITVTNTSRLTDDLAREPGAIVELYAGHAERAGLLFLGGVRRARTSSDGVDRVLEIESGDGELARGVNVSRTLRGTQKALDVLGELASAAGLDFDTSQIGDVNMSLARGLTLSGSVARAIGRVARLNRFDWTIEDGALVVVKRGSTTSLPALVVSSQTGLVGEPRPTDEGRLEIEMLTEPEARLRRLVRLESRDHSGWYVIRRIVHAGDSWSSTPPTTTLECTLVEEVSQ